MICNIHIGERFHSVFIYSSVDKHIHILTSVNNTEIGAKVHKTLYDSDSVSCDYETESRGRSLFNMLRKPSSALYSVCRNTFPLSVQHVPLLNHGCPYNPKMTPHVDFGSCFLGDWDRQILLQTPVSSLQVSIDFMFL